MVDLDPRLTPDKKICIRLAGDGIRSNGQFLLCLGPVCNRYLCCSAELLLAVEVIDEKERDARERMKRLSGRGGT